MKRFLIWLMAIVVTLLAAAPWLLYQAALAQLSELPTPPQPPYLSKPLARQTWLCLREKPPIELVPISPYKVAFDLITSKTLTKSPGFRAVLVVARAHIFRVQPQTPHLNRHVAHSGLTIWLSRNWTAEQITSAAYDAIKVMRDYRGCGIGRPYKR